MGGTELSLSRPSLTLGQEVPAHFSARFTPAALDRATAADLKVSPFLRSRRILQSEDLSEAIKGCDTYAKTKVVFGPMAIG